MARVFIDGWDTFLIRDITREELDCLKTVIDGSRLPDKRVLYDLRKDLDRILEI